MVGLVVLAAPETYEAAVIRMLFAHRRIHLSFRRERDHEVITNIAATQRMCRLARALREHKQKSMREFLPLRGDLIPAGSSRSAHRCRCWKRRRQRSSG